MLGIVGGGGVVGFFGWLVWGFCRFCCCCLEGWVLFPKKLEFVESFIESLNLDSASFAVGLMYFCLEQE